MRQRIQQRTGRRPWQVLGMAAVFCVLTLVACQGASLHQRVLLAATRTAQTRTPTFLATYDAALQPTSGATEAATPQLLSNATPGLTATALSFPDPASSLTQAPTLTATVTLAPTPTATLAPTDAVRTLRVPILMYHHIAQPPPNADAVQRDLSVSPEHLAGQLRFLREHGYTTISLADLADALEGGQPLPERPIILTFDDGYRDNFEQALPILQQAGMHATFFLLTSLIDEGNPLYITWDQALALGAAGMELGAHGYTHADLRDRSVDFLVWQMLGAKEAIEARTGKPVQFYCYPAGEYDAQAIAVLQSAHYRGAVTITMGQTHTSDKLFELRRVRVRGRYTAEDLGEVLAWLDAEGDPS